MGRWQEGGLVDFGVKDGQRLFTERPAIFITVSK
jgi:hypothetical protein